MRQPEVARLAALLSAVVLAVPVLLTARDALVAAAFLVEFLGGGRPAPLTALTSEPVRTRFAVEGTVADRWHASALRRPRALLLVHGVAAQGKDDRRVRAAAALLARAGFDVLVPTVPGLTRGRLRAEDVEVVVAALAARPGPATVLGVSVGAGPALLAAADPRVGRRVRTVLSLGGYASARAVLRFWLTGAFGFGDVHGRVAHDPAEIRAFARANADLLGAPGLAALEAADPGRAEAFLDALPRGLAAYLDALSPLRVVRALPARLVLVHGRDDRAVPYTESLRLAAARPARTRLVLVGVLGHVEAGASARWRDARDFAALWAVVYALVAGA